MGEVFDEYVRRLITPGEPPESGCRDEVCEHLRALLVTEMRKRRLWTAPPGYLGVFASSWQEPAALAELVADAHDFIFADRLRGLSVRLRAGLRLRGLVVRNVRNFLTDRQRRADPIGYRVFGRLRSAVQRCLEEGRLSVQQTLPRGTDMTGGAISNDTVLSNRRGSAPLAEAQILVGPASRWNDELMPELITADGRAVEAVTEALAERLTTLPADGVSAFRLGDLAKALKDDARCRWKALWAGLQETAPEDGQPAAPVVPVTRPETAPDWPRFRDAVLRCVEATLGAVRQAKRQRDLWRMWLFVRSTRVDAEEPRELPPYSRIGRELGLPRERVSQLLKLLRRLVVRCMEGGHEPASLLAAEKPAASRRRGGSPVAYPGEADEPNRRS